jgi:hypothetical protein
MEFMINWTHLPSGKRGTKTYECVSPVAMAIWLATWNCGDTWHYSCPQLSHVEAMGGEQRWGDHPKQTADMEIS